MKHKLKMNETFNERYNNLFKLAQWLKKWLIVYVLSGQVDFHLDITFWVTCSDR